MAHTPALKTWSKLIYTQLKSIIWPINWINTILKSFSHVASDLESITSPAASAFSGRKQTYTHHLYFCATWQFLWKITTGSHRTKSPFVDTSTVPIISSQPFYNAALAVLKMFLSEVTTSFPKLLRCERQHSVFQHLLHIQAESKKRAVFILRILYRKLSHPLLNSKQETGGVFPVTLLWNPESCSKSLLVSLDHSQPLLSHLPKHSHSARMLHTNKGGFPDWCLTPIHTKFEVIITG